MNESINPSFDKIEHQEINLDDFLKDLKKSKIKLQEIWQAEKQDKKLEEKELFAYEGFFDGKLDMTYFKNKINQYETKQTISQNSEKEKLITFWKLADLSYTHLKTNKNDKFDFLTVSLDPASFEHINTIFENPNIAILTNEEKFLYEFINEDRNQELDYKLTLNTTTNEILKIAGLEEQVLAMNDSKYRTVLSDIEPTSYYDNKKLQRRILLSNGLEQLIISKEIKAKQNFEELKQDYEIKDYFPNETKWDKTNSWFWAIYLVKDWKKYISIRWTEGLSDWKDLLADWKMIFWKIPKEQTKDMITFINRCIKPWEKFSIVWHSLGWALSQIATGMYKDQVTETYTFNSPWAKKLNVSSEDLSKFAKFKEFVHNKDSSEVWELITNVEGVKGISLISNLWEDIWTYKLSLKWLSSHSITGMINYIEKLPQKSEELKKIKKIDYKQKKPLKNKF